MTTFEKLEAKEIGVVSIERTTAARNDLRIFFDLFLKMIGVTPFMHQSQKEYCVFFHRVIKIVWKWPGAPTRKTMRAYMISALPFDHLSGLTSDTLTKALASLSEISAYFASSLRKSSVNCLLKRTFTTGFGRPVQM
jgi:hypothetical protein